MTERGVFAVDRGIFDRYDDGPYSRREALLWLISEAGWGARRKQIGSVVVDLQRGQLAHSLSFMATSWRWLTAAGKPDRPRVQRFLDRLKTDATITTSSDTGITVITLVNYDSYQFPARRTDTADDTATDTGPIQDRYKLEEGKKETTDSPPPPAEDRSLFDEAVGATKPTKQVKNPKGWPAGGFDRWYALYPRKAKPKDARRVFEKLQAAGELTFEELMAATQRFADQWAREPKDRCRFIPYPASWLNGGEYQTYLAPAANAAAPASQIIIQSPPRDWHQAVSGYRYSGRWSPTWGPRPGEPGSRAPPDVLEQFGYRDVA